MEDTQRITVKGLLVKRGELIAQELQARAAHSEIVAAIASLDYVLKTFGYAAELQAFAPPAPRQIAFKRNELRRYLIQELKAANGRPFTVRQAAEKLIKLRNVDPHDGRGRAAMLKAVAKTLALLRDQGFAASRPVNGCFEWSWLEQR